MASRMDIKTKHDILEGCAHDMPQSSAYVVMCNR